MVVEREAREWMAVDGEEARTCHSHCLPILPIIVTMSHPMRLIYALHGGRFNVQNLYPPFPSIIFRIPTHSDLFFYIRINYIFVRNPNGSSRSCHAP